MVTGICAICKNTENEDNVANTMYNAPREVLLREKWSKQCGIEIIKTAMVCQKHFEKNAFEGKGKERRLKQTAVPTLFLNCNSFSKENGDTIVDQVHDTLNGLETSDLIGLQIKSEPIELEPQVLINEMLFDERMGSPIQTSNSNKTSKNFCGRIAYNEKGGSRNYTLFCDFCSLEFSIHNGKDFIKHVEGHRTLLINELSSQQKILTKEILKDNISEEANIVAEVPGLDLHATEIVFPTFVNTTTASPVLAVNTETAKEQNEPEIVDKNEVGTMKTEKIDDDDYDVRGGNSGDDNYSDNDDDEDAEYEVTPKLNGRRSKKAKIDVDLYSDNDDDEDPEYEVRRKLNSPRSRKAKIDVDLISLSTTDPSIVEDFLEMIKAQPILWHRRQGAMKLFDAALQEFAKNFNEKHKLAYSETGLRDSIARFKNWHSRIAADNAAKKQQSKRNVKLTHPEYFKTCAEIEELSKQIIRNCEHCKQFFFNDVDLQVHLVKLHQIGELPFKCQRCNYGFTNAAKLAEHALKHDRKRSLFCEICKQGFFYESMLKSHMSTHTDDHMQICEICGKKFPTPSKYKRHKLHHEEPKERCELCGKSFYEKWTLSEHMKSHRNERQYRCDLCGKTFNRQEGVTIHKRGVHKVKMSKYTWSQKAKLLAAAATTASVSDTKAGTAAKLSEKPFKMHQSRMVETASTPPTPITNEESYNSLPDMDANTTSPPEQQQLPLAAYALGRGGGANFSMLSSSELLNNFQ